MAKSEENDLILLIRSLKQSTAKQFKKQLKLTDYKANSVKILLFDAIFKDIFDKDKFLHKQKLSTEKFNYLKFELFKNLINYLKVNYDAYSDIALQNEVIELQLLLKRKLFIKANRKLEFIKKIAMEKCDFETAYFALKIALKYHMFGYSNKFNSLDETIKEITKYRELADNLNAYTLLNFEVLQIHYNYLDKRVKDRSTLLEYLNHELLQDKSKALSILSEYHFYLIKSLIYIGNNDYQQGKKNSLLAYQHLQAHPSKYRDDYKFNSIALNNYLDSSLNLSETVVFEETYPVMIEMTKNSNKNDTYSKVNAFQQLCSLHLNYLWKTKDYATFLNKSKDYERDYATYETHLSPNFKIEILLGFAKMYFWNGNLYEAEQFCNKIIEEKANPASMYIVCANILRIMINIEMGNYKLIPHLTDTSKYSLKNRNRLFDVEHYFFNKIKKLKPYYSDDQKTKFFYTLFNEIKHKIMEAEEMVIDEKINILRWLQLKAKA